MIHSILIFMRQANTKNVHVKVLVGIKLHFIFHPVIRMEDMSAKILKFILHENCAIKSNQ